MNSKTILALRGAAVAGVATLALVPALAFAQVAEEQKEPQTEAVEQQAAGGVANLSSEEPAEDEIVITGTILRGTPPVGSNLISVAEERFQSQGATTANELLATVPQVTNLFNNVPSSRLSVAANQIQVVRPNLRNLSPETGSSSSTLVLFDGHRIAGVGATQSAVDPDIIPAAAIERVEIVTDGGSATYGADAVGGVINFITRKRFDGVKLDARYGIADDYQQVEASGIAGTDWGSGSVYAAYTYQHNDAIFGRDRDYIKQIDWNTGVPLGRSCDPGNVNLTRFDFTTFRFVTVTHALPGLTPNTFNACESTDDTSFVPRSTRHGAVAGLHQDLTDWLTVDVRAFYGKRESTSLSPFRGQASVTSAQAFYRPIASNPSATQTVLFTFAPILGTNSARSRAAFREWGANAEFAAEVTDNWQLRTLLNYSRSNSSFHIDGLNQTLLAAAGSASNPQQAVNFYDPAATPNLDLIRAIANGELAGQGKDSLFNARAILDGTLFELPGGEVKLAVGYEYLHDSFKQRVSPPNGNRGDISSAAFSPYKRSVHSAFGELQIPIFGEGNRTGGIYSLILAGSLRYDHFSDFGSTTNPKVGITYKPVSWFALRGNYSTSFNAPSPVDQLGSQRNRIDFFPFNAFVRPGDTPNVSGTVALQGSQPNLRPQTAKTYSFGVDVDPPFIPGLHASVNYYAVDFRNLLSQPTPNVGIFTNFPNNVQTNVNGVSVAQLQAFALLAPNGPAVINPLIAANQGVYELVDFRVGNFGTLKVKGLDFAANYRASTGFGSIDGSVSGNYQLKREGKTGPGAVVSDLLAPGNNASRLQLQATLGADVGNFRAQVTFNHSSGFKVIRATNLPQDRVGDFNTFNLFFKYDVPGESLLLKDLSFTLNVNNVFDADPPVFKQTGQNGYANGFTLGRLFLFGVSKRF